MNQHQGMNSLQSRTHYFLRVAFVVSDSFVCPPLFTVVPDLLLPLLLRLEELTPVVVDFPDVRFVPAFRPDG
jgi:hypothetical protein